MTLTDSRLSDVRPEAERPRLGLRAATAATTALSAAALGVGILEARLPLGPGNAAVHHGYPFFAVGMGVVLTLVAWRTRSGAPRWSTFNGALGAAYAVNALLVAALSLAVTPDGARLPLEALGWAEDVFFLVCDIGFVGLLVALLPDCRPQRRQRTAVAVMGGLTLLTMLREAVVPHVLDSTTVDNPLGLSVLDSWTKPTELLIPVVFVSAVVLSVVRGLQLARESRRLGTGVVAPARVAGLAMLGTFVGQAAVPESSPWGAGLVMLVGCAVSSIAAARVAVTLPAARARVLP